MSNVTIKVGSINERTVTTKYGPKKAYDLIADDGTKYGYGFQDPAKQGISVGSIITGPATAGKFGMALDPKATSLGGSASEVATTTAKAPAASSTGWSGRAEKVFPLPTTHGDTAIIRQNALTNAVSTVADYVATQPTELWPDLDKWTDMVITTAYKYAEFSSGQREIKAMNRLRGIGVEADEIKNAVEASLPKVDELDEE